jgi:hypothetical protein
VKPRLLLLLLLALVPLAIIAEVRAPWPAVRRAGTPAVAAAFADGFLEHLGSVQAAADALVDLGERRERNLLVVGQRQSSMNAALDATDAWLAQQAAHQGDPAVAAYRAGATGIRQAMADAQSAFLHFDWDGVAAANDTLKQGVADISTAADLLHAAVGT